MLRYIVWFRAFTLIVIAVSLPGCITFASKAIVANSDTQDARRFFDELRPFMEQEGFSETYFGKATDLPDTRSLSDKVVVGLYKQKSLSVDVYFSLEKQEVEVLINEFFGRSFSETAEQTNQKLIEFLKGIEGIEKVTVLKDP